MNTNNSNNSNEININKLNEDIQSNYLENNGTDLSINKNGDNIQIFSRTDMSSENLNLDNGEKNINKIDINPLNTQELIKGIIAKHKQLLDGYELEFSILDEKVQLINNGINSSNKNKEATINRVEVLKEKLLQFYHQILKLLGDLSGFNDIDNKLVHSISDKIVKLTKSKYLSDVDEIKQSINEIKVKISELTVENQDFELISTIIARLDDALEANLELISIHGNDEKFNEDVKKFEIELKGINSKHGWLKNRVESHKKAFEYWNLKLTEFETIDNGDMI